MLLVVLTLTALTLMTLDLSDGGNGPVTRLRHGAVSAFAPVQHAVAVGISPLSAAADWISDQRRLHDELAQLRVTAARLEAAAVQRDDALAENAALRRLLAMGERLELRTVGARVLGTVPGDPSSSVLLDAGANDGLAPDMTVVDDRGVVGRLVVVTADHARVELITSPRARYAVRVVAGRHAARMRGRGDGNLQLELDDPHAEVPAGTPVVTRTFEGSAVPDGLPVGTVAGNDGDRYRTVHPAAGLETLDIVQVLLGASQPSELPSGQRPSTAPLPPPPRASER